MERYGVSPWDIDVIAPGVDGERFRPGDKDAARRALGLPVGLAVAVTVRRLVPRMGLDVMVDAWPDVLSSLGSSALWLVVGDGPSRGALEARVVERGIAANVRFLGAVSDELLVTCFQAADLSVVPSVALEGFGLSVLESLACGTPVLTTDLAGLREAAGELGADWSVPAGDAGALADRLVAALGGQKALPTTAECRAYAERFSWEEVAKRHVMLFERVLAVPRNPSGRRARSLPPRDMRVLVVGHTAVLSGAELALVRLIEAMPAICFHVILGGEGPLADKLEKAGATVEVLALHPRVRELRRAASAPGRIPVRSVLSTAWYVARLSRRIRQINPDVVHTNTLKAAVYGGLAARLARRPCLWHIRDRIADDYLPRRSARMVRILARAVPTEVVANSTATLNALTLEGDVVHRRRFPRSSVVPSPVSMGEGITRLPGGDGAVTFVMASRLAPWKGQDVFVRAFATSFKGGPQRAIVAGAPLFGEERYGQELRALVAALGLDGQVEFPGFVHNMPDLLARADVLVHASVLPEPFGQVVVEGMSAALAVVASDQGGPAEVIVNEHDGLLVPPGDVAALAAALQRVALDPPLRFRLGQNGRQTAQQYRPEVVADQMTSIYRRLSGQEHPDSPTVTGPDSVRSDGSMTVR
jgi:glycosyltransferase involved in cell wall biosynthesis